MFHIMRATVVKEVVKENILIDDALFVDQWGRSKRKLRISVTDRCNFKCVYCMPEHPEWMKKQDLLSFEQLYQFCDFMVRRGIESIRITGGEPLMRQGVVHFIAQLQSLRALGLKRISMTSNAHYLKTYAQALKQAGLDDINISLDSLDAIQFKQLTQKELAPVLEGIAAAKKVALPIKINSVLMKGINDDQIIPLARWAIQQKISLRFIEFMPLDGDQHWSRAQVVSEQQILDCLSTVFRVSHAATSNSDPARQYTIDGHSIGIISTVSHSFCAECDRLRLTAQGEFYNCLFATKGLILKAYIEALTLKPTAHLAASFTINSMNAKLYSPQMQLQQILSDYIWHKEAGFHAIQQRLKNQSPDKSSRKISMHMLGG